MVHPFTRKARTTVAGIAALAIAFTGLATAPANAAPVANFTITDPATGQDLTTVTGTQGTAVNNTYDIAISPTGWNFVSGLGTQFYNLNGQKGLNASVSFADSTHATMTVTGNPGNGVYFDSSLTMWDGLNHRFTYPFRVAIAPASPTPHISVDAANHTYGNVSGLNTSGLFTSMPAIYLNTRNSGDLVALAPADHLAPTTYIDNGVTTISYTTGTLYNDPTYGDIVADVIITITDGHVAYQVNTWSMSWEGEPVAAGDIVFQGDLASGANTTSTTTGSDLATLGAGNPLTVFHTADGATPTLANGTVTMTEPSSAAGRSFEFSFYDYTGCPTIDELVGALQGGTLNVTGYQSATACAPSAPATPDQAQNITAAPVTDTTALLKWNWTNDYTNGFNVYLGGNYVGSTYQNTFAFAGLTPDTDYTATVETTSFDGSIKATPTQVTFHTNAVVTPVAKVITVDCSLLDGYGSFKIKANIGDRVSLVFGSNCDGIADLLGGSGNGTPFNYVSDFGPHGTGNSTAVASNWVIFGSIGEGYTFTADIMADATSTGAIHDGSDLFFIQMNDGRQFNVTWSDPNAGNGGGGNGSFGFFSEKDKLTGTGDSSMVTWSGDGSNQVACLAIDGFVFYCDTVSGFGQMPFTWDMLEQAILSAGMDPLVAHTFTISSYNGNDVTPGAGPVEGAVATSNASIVIDPVQATTTFTPAFNHTSFGNGTVDTLVMWDASATGFGADVVVYSATNLPAGLSINAATGVITGTPTIAGDYDFTVTASDVDNNALFASQQYTGTIAAAVVPPVVVPPVVIPPVVVPPAVIPPVVVAPVTNGTYAPSSTSSTTLGWTTSKDANTVIVTVNGTTIATLPGDAVSYVASGLIGPKDTVEVIVKDAAGNASVLASFAYVPHGDIALGGVTFGADSAKLTASAKAALKKYATAIIAHGFTTATVAAFTKFDASRSAAFRVKLAKARAAAITVYLNAQFKAAGATVKVTSTGKGVKARTGVITTK